MANILILRDVNTGDKDIKTGVAEVELENGFAVALGEVSAERKTRNAFFKYILPSSKFFFNTFLKFLRLFYIILAFC